MCLGYHLLDQKALSRIWWPQSGFGKTSKLVPIPNISEVFDYVGKDADRVGIVPIENSSGGTIYETVDCLVDEQCSACIVEELSIKVNLALLGRAHFTNQCSLFSFCPAPPLQKMAEAAVPHLRRIGVASTALAAQTAANEWGAVALGTRQAAKQ